MKETTEVPEMDEEVIEEVAEKSAKLIGKKILKWTGVVVGFAAAGLGLALLLAPKDDENIYVLEETGEVVDPEEVDA